MNGGVIPRGRDAVSDEDVDRVGTHANPVPCRPRLVQGNGGRTFQRASAQRPSTHALYVVHRERDVAMSGIGDAKIYGSELELRALVASGLTLSLNAGSTHAYISSVSSQGSGIVYVGESVLACSSRPMESST